MKRLLTKLLTAILAVSILASLAVGASAIELKTGIGIVESNGLRLRAKPNTHPGGGRVVPGGLQPPDRLYVRRLHHL